MFLAVLLIPWERELTVSSVAAVRVVCAGLVGAATVVAIPDPPAGPTFCAQYDPGLRPLRRRPRRQYRQRPGGRGPCAPAV